MNYYQILEIEQTASSNEIDKAYRKLALKWHPDKNLNNKEEAESKFKKLGEIYDILKDGDKRKEYDESLKKKDRPNTEHKRKRPRRKKKTNHNTHNNSSENSYNNASAEPEWGESNMDRKRADEIFKMVDLMFKKYTDEMKRRNDLGKEMVDCAQKGYWDLVFNLVDCQATIDTRDDRYNTALHYATLQNNFEAVKYLLHKGANLSVKDLFGNTAIHIATSTGKTEIAIYMMGESQDRCWFWSRQDFEVQNNDGDTVLLLALKHRNSEIANCLLNKGASVLTLNKQNETAFSYFNSTFSYFNFSNYTTKELMRRRQEIELKAKEEASCRVM